MHGYRLTLLAGVATGYVLGARAGRERYEQIKKFARTAADHPAVQQAAGALQAQAAGAASSARARISGELHQRAQGARQKMTDRLPGHRGANGSAGSPGTGEAGSPFAAASSRAERNGHH
ncbi:MAG: hypothetical protein ACLQDY_02840 [Streptosporangiaceae bacterium]